jgi:hypothetical protein
MITQENIQRFVNELPDRLLVYVGDLAALSINRIQQTGQAAQGGQFSPYSQTPLEPSSFMSSAIRKGAQAQLEQLKGTGKKLSYADFRKLVGNQTAFKDFTLSGRTLSQYGVIETGTDGTNSFAILGFFDKDSNDIYNDLVNQEKREILEPSEEELEMAADNIIDFMFNILEND